MQALQTVLREVERLTTISDENKLTNDEMVELLSHFYFTINDKILKAETSLNLCLDDNMRINYFRSIIRRDVGFFDNIYDIVNHLVNKEITVDKEPTIPINLPSTDISTAKRDPIIIKHPKNKMLPIIGKSALYVRESYYDLYDLITNQVTISDNHAYKFLITGTSGIGKSGFLIFLLIRLLCNSGVTVIFQSNVRKKIFYCFNNNTLKSGSFHDFSFHFRSYKTWYLADGILSPELVQARTVVALPPEGVIKDDFQEFDKILVMKYYMPPWSYKELSDCQKEIFPDVPEAIMATIYDMAGGVPRYVLQWVEHLMEYGSTGDELVYNAFERVQFALNQVTNIILCVNENFNFLRFSSRLVYQWPSPCYRRYSLKWGSYYIHNELVKQVSNNLLENIQTMRSDSFARRLIFEIHLFQAGGSFVMRHLSRDGERSLKDRKLIISHQQINNFVRTTNQLSSIIINDGTLVLPTFTNFDVADLLFTPDTILQITVSDNHPIKQEGLVNIVENMPTYKKGGTIRLVFVVPDDIYDSYKHQDIVTKDEKTKTFRKVQTMDSKLNNVQQWVLKIDMTGSRNINKRVRSKNNHMDPSFFG